MEQETLYPIVVLDTPRGIVTVTSPNTVTSSTKDGAGVSSEFLALEAVLRLAHERLSLQNRVDLQEATIRISASTIEGLNAKIKQQQEGVLRADSRCSEAEQTVLELQAICAKHSALIEEQRAKIDRLTTAPQGGEVSAAQHEAALQRITIDQQERSIKGLERTIKSQEEKIKSLELTIDRQSRTVDSQANTIKVQRDKIADQSSGLQTMSKTVRELRKEKLDRELRDKYRKSAADLADDRLRRIAELNKHIVRQNEKIEELKGANKELRKWSESGFVSRRALDDANKETAAEREAVAQLNKLIEEDQKTIAQLRQELRDKEVEHSPQNMDSPAYKIKTLTAENLRLNNAVNKERKESSKANFEVQLLQGQVKGLESVLASTEKAREKWRLNSEAHEKELRLLSTRTLVKIEPTLDPVGVRLVYSDGAVGYSRNVDVSTLCPKEEKKESEVSDLKELINLLNEELKNQHLAPGDRLNLLRLLADAIVSAGGVI